jgi:hypothetical protein
MGRTQTSQAFGQLSLLKGEFASAKSRWDALLDRIVNGYKDAYKDQKAALDEFRKIRELHAQQDAAVMMFILNVVGVGFAGGFTGGLMANWVRNAGVERFKTGVRAAVQEMAKTATKEAAGGVIQQLRTVGAAAPIRSPYVPVAPDAFDVYLEKREELDICFARYDKLIDDLQKQANAEDWGIETGWAIFNGFRAGCPLLRDKPDPDNLPDRADVQKAAELCMWVDWADERDWPWWNKQYRLLDAGMPSDAGEQMNYKLALRYAVELVPILGSLNRLGITGQVQSFAASPTYPGEHRESVFLDLRKLRALKVQTMPDLPFGAMKTLDFHVQTSLELRGNFLDDLSDLRPFYKRRASP